MAYRLLSSEPRWVDIAGDARIQIAPVNAVRMLRARARLDRDAPVADDAAGQAEFVLALAAECIVGWEGIEDANGDPADVSPEAIEALLDDYRVFEAFQAAVLGPYMERIAEKNASAPAPSGTSEAAQPIADGAGS